MSIRLTIVQTHPVQYFAPWFRHIVRACPDLELTVLYAVQPSPEQQAAGFGDAFEWDVPLLDGYVSVTVANADPGADVGSSTFRGVDVRIVDALAATRPDVVLIPGWHSITYLRAARWCRRNRVPLLWRGDTHRAGRLSLAWSIRTRMLLRMFDWYLAVGRDTRDYLTQAGVHGARIFASPHHVDNDRFALDTTTQAAARTQVRGELGIGDHDFVILFVGKVAAHKRPLDVIEAAASMERDVTVLMAGAGLEREACIARARERGVRLVTPGFINQQRMPSMFAAADVLVVAGAETWGLVVNEALAAGIPVVANHDAGATRDLVVPGLTGERFEMGDIPALASALERIRSARATYSQAACRNHIARYTFETATRGLLAACQAATHTGRESVVALCGSLFIPSGMERMTFEVLSVVRRTGARLHCIVNDWAEPLWPGGPTLVMAFAESIGATWSTASYRERLSRSTNPLRQLPVLYDSIRTSWSTLRSIIIVRPTTVFVPEFGSVLRTLPVLAAARLARRRVVLRLPTALPVEQFYRRLWRVAIDPVVSIYVAASKFAGDSLLDFGVSGAKLRTVPNRVPARHAVAGRAAAARTDTRVRIVYVGQIIPGKGLHVLLDALEIAISRGADLELDVVGDITGWATLENTRYRDSLIERSGRDILSGRVRFLGVRDDVPAIMEQADIHCCPSLPELREAFGIVVVEAKSAGLPSIVFESGGLPEHIRDGVDGIICRRPDAPTLAEAILSLSESESRRMAMAAAARASAGKYDPALFEAAWLDIFGLRPS